jgi:hypothetical protein
VIDKWEDSKETGENEAKWEDKWDKNSNAQPRRNRGRRDSYDDGSYSR